MSNIKQTIYLDEIVYEDECNIDFLCREEEFCLQISAPDGRILQREFVALDIKNNLIDKRKER